MITDLTSPSCWIWAGGGGTDEPERIQEVPGAGRDVGLMYSFSSPSDAGVWLLEQDTRDLMETEDQRGGASRSSSRAGPTWQTGSRWR